MSYTFDPTSGATRDQLTELVIANSFSATRYTEFVYTWLNDAVTDVCRRLRIQRSEEILSYDADGLVDQPNSPYFQVEELWLAYPSASGSGPTAVAQGAYYRLEPLPTKTAAGMRASTPAFYTVRRETQAGRAPAPAITVIPATAAGKVAIVGLQRPAVMDAAADTSGLGADLDDALVAFVKARCFRSEDDFEMSAQWKLEYEACLRSYLQTALQSDGPITTPGAWHEGLLADGGR